jgi:hypothetical protein
MKKEKLEPNYPTSVVFAQSDISGKFQSFQTELATTIQRHKNRYGCKPIFADKAIELTLQLTDEVERITQLAQRNLYDALAENKDPD